MFSHLSEKKLLSPVQRHERAGQAMLRWWRPSPGPFQKAYNHINIFIDYFHHLLACGPSRLRSVRGHPTQNFMLFLFVWLLSAQVRGS